MLIDHIGLAVSDYKVSRAFYSACLKPLNIGLIVEIEDEGWVGFGRGDKADFWFGSDDKVQHPMHIAFHAENRAQVDAFYQAALAAGGVCNGGPGLHPEYHEHYYSAFVLDPDGHNIEAVCYDP